MAAQQVLYSELQRLGRLEYVEVLAVVHQTEAYSGPGESHADEFFRDMFQLHVVRFEELSPCRHIVEKISYGNAGSCRCGDFCGGDMSGVCEFDLAADLVFRPPGFERDFRNGCDGGQCLAPEAESGDVHQVLRSGNLGCGVSLEAQHSLVRSHSAAIVNDLYQCPSGIGQYHRDLVRSCIHCILHQFLDC